MSRMRPGGCVGVAQEKGLNCVSGHRRRKSKKPEDVQTGHFSYSWETVLINLHCKVHILEVSVSPVPLPEGTGELQKCSEQGMS